MGGRTAMYLSLKNPELVEKLVVVDVSPVNIEFDVTDSTEWNMSHFFYAMKAVEFPQNVSISQARKSGDSQLSKRISDPGLRAWLLMNVYQDSQGTIHKPRGQKRSSKIADKWPKYGRKGAEKWSESSRKIAGK